MLVINKIQIKIIFDPVQYISSVSNLVTGELCLKEMNINVSEVWEVKNKLTLKNKYISGIFQNAELVNNILPLWIPSSH